MRQDAAVIRDRLDAQVHRTIPVIALVSIAVYLLSIAFTAGYWPAHLRPLVIGFYFTTVAVDVGILVAHRRGAFHPRHANTVVATFLVMGALQISSNVLDPRGSEQTFSAILSIFAAGVLLLSWKHFAIASAASLGAGVLVARAMPEATTDLGGFAVLLAVSVAIAALLHALRLRSARRVEWLLLDNEEKRLQLENALDELRRTHEQAVTREKLSALGTLVAGVAHEINNPLTYMRGNVELTEMSLRDASRGVAAIGRQEAAELADQQAAVIRGLDRIEHIAKSLKRVARAPSSDTAPEDVNAIVDSVLTVANARTPPSVEVVRDLRARSLAEANSGDISQVVLNLVLNAIEVMPGGGTLRLATRDEKDAVVIEVSDTGPGIPPDIRARIFTPFFTTKHSGTGLGLSISHRIVEQHGGSIVIDPEPRAGALLRVRLPRARPRPMLVHAQGS